MSYSPKTFLAFLCFFLSFGMIAAAACRNAPIIFNFGDSNSDTGGASVLGGSPLKFPEGRTFFHEPTGRVCDGRLVLDFLCESLETKFLTPYLELFAPDFSNGVNFALASSDTLQGILPYVAYTLRNQILQFNRFYNISISRGSIDEEQFKTALYMFDIGQNDINGQYLNKTLDEILSKLIPHVISNVREAMQTVYQLGGRNFWVHNTGPAGCLPDYLSLRNDSTAIDEYGCIAGRNRAAVELNAEMERLCQKLRLEMAGATIVYVDIYAIKLDLIVNSTLYGFEDPFVKCLAKQGVCPEGSRYMSWDGVHYTEAANMFVTSKILSTNFSTPPKEFNFFCNI